jgi:hypothetical protein
MKISTEEADRKAAWLAGCSVEEWRRRGQVALSSREKQTAGGFVMCEVAPGGRGLVHMSGSDGDDAGLGDENMSAKDCGMAAQDHLKKFLDGPNEPDAHEHIARAAAMLAAAGSRLAGEAKKHAKIASGAGLMHARW